MIKVAFVGRPGAGQRLSALYLWHKYDFKKLNLMDGVNRVLKTLYNPGQFKKFHYDKRLIVYDALYKTDPDIFIRYIEYRLQKGQYDVVTADARYLTEVQKLKELGFVIIRVSRPNFKQNLRGSKTASKNTVALLDAFDSRAADKLSVDYSIYWETKQQLYESLDKIITKLLDLDATS